LVSPAARYFYYFPYIKYKTYKTSSNSRRVGEVENFPKSLIATAVTRYLRVRNRSRTLRPGGDKISAFANSAIPYTASTCDAQQRKRKSAALGAKHEI